MCSLPLLQTPTQRQKSDLLRKLDRLAGVNATPHSLEVGAAGGIFFGDQRIPLRKPPWVLRTRVEPSQVLSQGQSSMLVPAMR